VKLSTDQTDAANEPPGRSDHAFLDFQHLLTCYFGRFKPKAVRKKFELFSAMLFRFSCVHVASTSLIEPGMKYSL
jgi:hypothetical protein